MHKSEDDLSSSNESNELQLSPMTRTMLVETAFALQDNADASIRVMGDQLLTDLRGREPTHESNPLINFADDEGIHTIGSR